MKALLTSCFIYYFQGVIPLAVLFTINVHLKAAFEDPSLSQVYQHGNRAVIKRLEGGSFPHCSHHILDVDSNAVLADLGKPYSVVPRDTKLVLMYPKEVTIIDLAAADVNGPGSQEKFRVAEEVHYLLVDAVSEGLNLMVMRPSNFLGDFARYIYERSTDTILSTLEMKYHYARFLARNTLVTRRAPSDGLPEIQITDCSVRPVNPLLYSSSHCCYRELDDIVCFVDCADGYRLVVLDLASHEIKRYDVGSLPVDDRSDLKQRVRVTRFDGPTVSYDLAKIMRD